MAGNNADRLIGLKLTLSPAPTKSPGGFRRRNSTAVVAILSSAVSNARDEVRILNTPADSAQRLCTSTREATHHFVPWTKKNN